MRHKDFGTSPGRLAEGQGRMRRLRAILGYEGVAGIYDRIRYPKPFWKKPELPSSIRGPVRIRGGQPDERRQVKRALQDFGIEIAPTDAAGAELIHLAPAWPDPAQVTKTDILIDTLSTEPDRLDLLAPKCRALLTICPSRLARLIRKGVPLEKLFLLKDGERLHEGLTRCLLALQHGGPGRASWQDFLDLQDLPKHPRICLGLSETIPRRQSFLSKGLRDFTIFDGIRRNPGWVGTGESFRVMAQACLDQDVKDALFTEDDVELPADFEDQLAGIRSYLKGCDWDVFSGLITDVGPGYRVTKVVRREGRTFVHLNRCVGMVFGLYHRNALLRLAAWDEASGLTIDRHLEGASGIEVVTTLPFLAGHNNGLMSSIWRFSNQRYSRLIRTSEERLWSMVKAHEARNVTKA